MIKVKNLVGKIFSRLTVTEFAYMKNHISYRKCKCQCGNEIITRGNALSNGHTNSCGCYRKYMLSISKNHTTHGQGKTRLYRIWTGMRTRCYNKNFPKYKYWGGRGIKICDRWDIFENFYTDMYSDYVDHVERFGEKGTTIDRFPDNDGDYEPGNTRRATPSEQLWNQRKFNIITNI